MSELNLVEKIAGFIERFVFMEDQPVYRLLALWVIQTHLYKEFEYAGYVFACSPEPQSGKSRLLEILDLLVANSSGVLHNPTAAILFRVEGGTQLFDEVDTWTDGGDYLRGVLNAGFHRGSTVKRNERQKDGKWKPVDFDVYAPRAMAGIGDGILHGTTKDRTFIVSMVKKTHLEHTEKFRSRKVKPEWAAQDKLFEGFFEELSTKIGADSTSKDAAEAAKKVRLYGAMLSAAASITGHFRKALIWSLVAAGVLGVIPVGLDSPYFHAARAVFGILALATASLLGMFGEAADKVATYLTAKSEATRKGINDLKSDLRSLMTKLGKTVLVVVDDLDRLTPDEIRMVFQLVKANADFPSLVYLLLFQRDTVERALSRNNEVDGAQFLSKIVQVGFDIPKMSGKQLEAAIELAVSRAVQGGPAEKRFDSGRWAKLFVPGVLPYFQTLRDVKRFGDALSFYFELYKNGDSFDADPVDLIALEVLRQYEPALYQKLHGERALLTGEYGLILELPDKRKTRAETLLQNAKQAGSARSIVEDVFPPVALALSGAKVSPAVFRSEWLKDLRPCHPQMFERYFRFSLSGQDLSTDEFSSLLALAAAGDRQGISQKLREFSGKGLLKSAVIRLQAHGPSIVTDQSALPFIAALFDMEMELFAQPSVAGVAGLPTDIQVLLIIRAVLQHQSPEQRSSTLRDAISSTTALYLPMISFESSDEERAKALDPLVSSEGARLLEEACVEKVREAKRSELLSHPRLRYILRYWFKWTTEQEVRIWVAEAAKLDSALLALLVAFTEAMNEVEEGRVVSSTYRFALEDFAQYADIEALAERARRLASTGKKESDNVRLFLHAFDRWKSTGRMPYPQNLDDWIKLEQLRDPKP